VSKTSSAKTASIRFPVWPERLEISVPGTATLNRMSLAPNGNKIAFVTGDRMVVRDLLSGSEQPIEGTEGAGSPFWSPNGSSIAFTAGGFLKRVDLDGGSPQVLCRIRTNLPGTWSTSGDILIGEIADGLFRVADTGGTLTRVTSVDTAAGETRHLLPRFLPDGRRYLYVAATGKPRGHMLYAGTLGTDRRVPVMPVESQVIYAEGRLLFTQNASIVSREFDLATLRPAGPPYPIDGPVHSTGAVGSALDVFIFSAEGSTLAFCPMQRATATAVATRPKGPAQITVVRNWVR
jgi:hypothetical protein